MVKLYVRLILAGIRTLEEVPENLREKVKDELEKING